MKFQDERYERAVCRWIEVTFDLPLGSVREPELEYWEGCPGYSEWTPPEPEEYKLVFKVPNADPIDGTVRYKRLDGNQVVKLVTEVGQYLA